MPIFHFSFFICSPFFLISLGQRSVSIFWCDRLCLSSSFFYFPTSLASCSALTSRSVARQTREPLARESVRRSRIDFSIVQAAPVHLSAKAFSATAAAPLPRLTKIKVAETKIMIKRRDRERRPIKFPKLFRSEAISIRNRRRGAKGEENRKQSNEVKTIRNFYLFWRLMN